MNEQAQKVQGEQNGSISLSDEEFEALEWHDIDSHALCEHLCGCRIIAAEPVDWPIPTGMLLELENRAGAHAVLDISTVTDDDGGPTGEMYVKMAVIPA